MKRDELLVKRVGHASTLRCSTGERAGGGLLSVGGGRQEEGREQWRKEINISATWPLKPLPMTANIMKRYGSREGGRNEKDKRIVK